MAQEKPIAWDGIVNQEQYRRTKVKVAFLLKEVNYPLARELIFPGAKEQCLPCGANYFCWGRTKVVEFVHPAWFTVPRKILFAYFKAVYSDLLVIL